MEDARSAATEFVSHDGDRGFRQRRGVAAMAGGGALLGAVAGVMIAIPLVESGVTLFIATALDIAAGMALMGALIGANIAGSE